MDAGPSSQFQPSGKEGVRLESNNPASSSGALPGSANSGSTEALDQLRSADERLAAVAADLAQYRSTHSAEHMRVMENEIGRGKSVEEADKTARMRVGE